MNILAKILQIITLVPSIVAGIETIHGNSKSGADKKTLAMQSLGLAVGVADATDPNNKATIDAVGQFAATTIDNTVALFNSLKFGPFGAVPAALPPATPPANGNQ